MLKSILFTAMLSGLISCQQDSVSDLSSDKPVPKPYMLGKYKVVSDLENPVNEELPKVVEFYYDHQLKNPKVWIKWHNDKTSKFSMSEYYHSSYAGSDSARVQKNNSSHFRWYRNFNPASDGQTYMDYKTFIGFKKVKGGIEFEYISKREISRYKNRIGEGQSDEKPSIEKKETKRRYLLKRI